MTNLSSVQFSRSVVSDSLQPHELQHSRPPCPSPTPGVHLNSCPLSWWCHPTTSSSSSSFLVSSLPLIVVHFSSCPKSIPASGSFPVSQLFPWGGQSIGVSASASVLPMNTQAMVFPVVMYGCESWTIKKAEHWRIDAFELWCWSRLLGVPWTARRSNQSILKEISPGVHWKDSCWSWNSNTLATPCEELTHWKSPWCWEGLGAGGEVDNRGWDGWMASLTRWAWVWVNGSLWWTGRPGMLQLMGLQRVGHDWATKLNWTEVATLRLWFMKLSPKKVNHYAWRVSYF